MIGRNIQQQRIANIKRFDMKYLCSNNVRKRDKNIYFHCLFDSYSLHINDI